MLVSVFINNTSIVIRFIITLKNYILYNKTTFLNLLVCAVKNHKKFSDNLGANN